jgi:NADH-quinone oxidoreductase subunit L
VISNYAWLIPVLPAVSAAIIIFFGKRFPKKGAEVGILSISLALVLAGAIAFEVFGANLDAVSQVQPGIDEGVTDDDHAFSEGVQVASTDDSVLLAAAENGDHFIPEGTEAFVHEAAVILTPIGDGFDIEAGIRIDGLTAMMFLLVTFVSLMVHIYSSSYMHGDPRFTWYFALLSLFTASMLLLVISNNLMLLLVGWELVGVCSFLLIGFWWEEGKNSNAAIKAFLTTKFGDIGLIVGVIGMWSIFQTFNIGEIIAAVGDGVQAGGEPINTGLLAFSLLALLLGAIGKSAQFPLHTWLPDAMAGPTPVSALIHAATMVTAGVFLVARLYPVYSSVPAVQTTVAIVGVITLFSAGLLALVQDDVKKVLAYSTISQLGYMVAALGFSYTAGIFHLFTHGFFKALLFLGAGSLIHAAHSNNMSDMGGMKKFMPATFWTFLIGSLALMAIPPFAGFWSKDEILAVAVQSGTVDGWIVAVLGALGGLVTAFYMTRVLYLVFAGEYRGHGTPHESPRLMTGPLIALAVPSVLIGLINLPFAFFQPVAFAGWTMFTLEYWVTHPVEFVLPIAIIATVLAAIGFVAGRAIYREAPERDPLLHMGFATSLLQNRYYMDHLYEGVIVRGIKGPLANASYWFNDNVLDRIVYSAGAGASRAGKALYETGDQKGIDGAINGLGLSAIWSGAKLKLAQSGNVQLYAGAMFVGVFVLAIAFAATTT